MSTFAPIQESLCIKRYRVFTLLSGLSPCAHHQQLHDLLIVSCAAAKLDPEDKRYRSSLQLQRLAGTAPGDLQARQLRKKR